jgi:hypothetical protein
MESEHLQNFNDRLSQWVADQGFWFQLRYSMSGSGAGGNVVFQLLKLTARVLGFVLVMALVVTLYLTRRTGTEGFREEVRESLKSGLHASELEMQGLRHVQGELGINGIAAKGDNGTFFSALEARNVRCKMSFIDGLLGKWDPGTVSISRLELDLRAGADDDGSANRLADSLFGDSGGVPLKSIEVTDATLHWGYGRSIAPKSLSLADPTAPLPQGFEFEHTKGSISNSFMRVQRIGDELRITLRGGKFSQNWLRDLEIVNMEVVCDRSGIRFERATFRRLQGTVDFSGLTVAGGARPRINGTVVIRNLPLGGILPPSARAFVEGSLSGDFEVSGSTNSSEGIIYEGGVTLSTPDMISVRERLHLLEALSVVDYSRNYHRIDFREGSFHLKTSNGGLELTDLHLKSEDPISLDGRLEVRLPTYEEMVEFREKWSVPGGMPRFDSGDEDLEALEESNDVDFSLRRAAEEANRDTSDKTTGDSSNLFGQLESGMNMRRFSEQSSENLTRTLRYQGEFVIGLPPDAFERAPRLSEKYPVDPASRRIPVNVPVEGSIYEITLKQAESIYLEGRR